MNKEDIYKYRKQLITDFRNEFIKVDHENDSIFQ